MKTLENGKKMAGVVLIANDLPLRTAIEDLLVIATCSENVEWLDQIVYLLL